MMKADFLKRKKNSYQNSESKAGHDCSGHDAGAALIFAVIVISILIIFTFSLSLIAYTLYASQTKNIASMRCREAANSLSVALGDELTYEDTVNNKYPESESYLYKYLRYNLCQDTTWPYYVSDNTVGHDRKAAVRYFKLSSNGAKKVYDADMEVKKDADGDGILVRDSGVEGLPGKTEVAVYWMLPDGTEEDIQPGSLSSRKGIRLFIEVTCEAASQSYTVKHEYIIDKTPEYNINNNIQRIRKKSITDAQDNVSINPCGFVVNEAKDEINSTEMWVWKKVTE